MRLGGCVCHGAADFVPGVSPLDAPAATRQCGGGGPAGGGGGGVGSGSGMTEAVRRGLLSDANAHVGAAGRGMGIGVGDRYFVNIQRPLQQPQVPTPRVGAWEGRVEVGSRQYGVCMRTYLHEPA